jgi:hypothetical protein
MIKIASSFSRVATLAVVTLGLSGCSNMDDMQQRIVSGSAIGVVTGAVATAATGGCVACGIAIGGAVGAAGGYIVHELDVNTRDGSSPPPPQQTSYNNNNSVPQGYPPGGYQN